MVGSDPLPDGRMLKLTRPLCVIDTETTGTETTDRVIEIGVTVLSVDGARKNWEQRFHPGIPIPPAATEVHGITDADVADKPPFSEFASRIHRGLTDRDIAGYNVRFDLSMIDEELRRCGLKLDLSGIHVIDAAGIFFKKEPRTLTAAVQKYCDRSHEEAHGAAADASASLDVLEAQLAMYEDLAAMDLAGVAQFSKRDEVEYIDLAGKLYLKDGFVYYGFGKEKDKRLKDEPGFARWMLNKDFSGSTLDVVRAELGRWGL